MQSSHDRTAALSFAEPLVAEYALAGIDKPIGVAEYQLVHALPEPLAITAQEPLGILRRVLTVWQSALP